MKPFIPEKLPLEKIEWERLVPLIGRAQRALAMYRGVLYGVPEPGVLLSPMTTQEAVMSSRIEGTQTTLGEVLRYEAGEEPEQEARRLDIQEIINYRLAMREAEDHLERRPFNLNLLLELHSTLMDSVRGRDRGRGTFRMDQNWIGRPGSPIEEAEFVPPEPAAVLGALDNWERYYHGDEPDPLVQLAVVHAQFEIVHPFLDGNGRIGRILIPLYLHEKELLDRPIFYISEFLEEHRSEYVGRLRAIGREPDGWLRWIEFFLRAIEVQAEANTARASGIIDLYEERKARILDLTHSQYAVPMLDQMFQKPLFRGTDFSFQGDRAPSRQAVAKIVRTLRDDGMIKLVRRGAGRRPSTYAFAELINLCEGAEVF